MAKNIRQFKKFYGVEIIPGQLAGCNIADLVWNPIIGADRPYGNLMNEIRQSGLVDAEEYDSVLRLIDEIEMENWGFFDRTIKVDVDQVAEIEHPKLQELSAKFNLERTKQFSFVGERIKMLPTRLRLYLTTQLDKLKENDWDRYNGRMRRTFVITGLYYAKVNIQLDTELVAEFEAAVEQANLHITSKTTIGREVNYTFDDDSIPFAYRLEPLKELN